MQRSSASRRAMIAIGAALLVGAAAGASLAWMEPAHDLRCDVVSTVDVGWFDGQRARLLPSQRAGFAAEGEVRGGVLRATGALGPGAAAVEVERAQGTATELVGRWRLRCREPIPLVPLSAEVSGVVDGDGADRVEGCGAPEEEAAVDVVDGSFFFYGEPGACTLRACGPGGCGPRLDLVLEHEGSVVVELSGP